ncbi:hypothetical protein Tco_0923899 [Tanacetum coccineum]|uniref:Uncharacterized protein n=1 Tax=Tanacetum coccineum TaxID=301880 RepID=A0ABQ5D299_9ASTR
MLDYGFNFMNTKIYIDNESTICIVKNPVFHFKTKHIEIRHHFIKDSYEKRLIQVIKTHTDYNVVDLLTKAFNAKHIENLVGDEAVHKELSDRMERAATTASSLKADIEVYTARHILMLLGEVNTARLKETASASTSENEEMEITATIDGRVKTIIEASIGRHLKLEDADGISSIPNTEIFEQLALIGYASDSDKLTFQKEEPATMPHDSSQPRVQSLGSNEGSLTLNELTVLCTTLSKKVEDLQNDLKHTKLTYGAAYTKLILRVKKLEHKTRTSADTEILLDQEEPTELVEDFGSGEKGEKEISTANILVSTASEIPKVSTAGVSTTEAVLSTVIPEVSTTAENLVYIRRSAEKRKDKGKAIMKEDESVQKKTKKQLEQERLSHEAAIRLQEQVNEEERQRIARDAEIAKQLQEEIDTARQEQEKSDLEKALELQKQLDEREEVVAKADPAQVIDWSDPAVLRYHAQQNRSFSKAEVRKNMCMYLKNQGGYKQSHFKGMSYEDIRPIFERVWDQNQSFVPKDSEIEKEVMKRSRFDFQKPPAKRQKIGEVSGSVEEQSAGKEKEVLEEELKKLLVIVPVEEVYIEALQRFDRDDLEKLWDLVKKKFSSTEPTIDKEKVLWVELKRLFEPDDDDTLWKLQRYMHDPLKWRLYDTCGVHHVSTERGHDIFMLVEKDYPLTRALMTVMLVNKLQVDESSEMANELLRKIFYQVNHKFRGGLTKKIMETINVTFDELSAMDFEQRSSKPGLQSMTSRQISSGLDLTYASSTITSQKPTERELDLLFEDMYDDYIGGQPSAATRTALAAQAL